jgi:hypothetical protein
MSAGTNRTRILFALCLILPLAVYAAWAARLIGAGVGYEMDEAIYVESAVYLLRGNREAPPPFVHEPAAWIRVAGRQWPLMIIPYVGAAKAYAALPLFAAFGISTETARALGVLLGGLGIAGLATLIASQVGLGPAFWTALFLAIHPSYLDLTVFDNGGTAVWMGAMGLLALALTNHLRRGSASSLFWLGLAAGLAVWARANLLWLLASGAAAALVVFGRRVVPDRRALRALAAGSLLGVLPLVWYEAASWLATLRYMASARQPLTWALVAERLKRLADCAISDREQRVIWGGPPIGAWELAVGAALLGLSLLALFVPADPDRLAWAKWRRAFALTALFLTAIVMTSRLNVSQHHSMAVVPLAFAALAILAVERAGRHRAVAPLVAAGAGALAVLFLAWDVRIDRGLRATGGIRAFSSAIDDVAAHLAAHPVAPDRLKILNWGIQNNLYVVSGGAAHGTELFWNATRKRTQQGRLWEDEIRDGGAFLLFAFPMGPPSIADGAAGFTEALARHGARQRETVFRERSGAPYARLIEIEPAR